QCQRLGEDLVVVHDQHPGKRLLHLTRSPPRGRRSRPTGRPKARIYRAAVGCGPVFARLDGLVHALDGEERAAPCPGREGVVGPGRDVDVPAGLDAPAERSAGAVHDGDVMVGAVVVPAKFGTGLEAHQLGGPGHVGDRDGVGDDRVGGQPLHGFSLTGNGTNCSVPRRPPRCQRPADAMPRRRPIRPVGSHGQPRAAAGPLRARAGDARSSATAAAVRGRAKRYPWPRSQPLWMRKSRWAVVSTPSATTSRPRAWAMAIMATTIAPSPAFPGSSDTKARSILSRSRGKYRSRERTE